MHRLFVAIDLPDAVKHRVAALRRDLPGARWVEPEQLHLTLRFIGDANDLALKAIRDALTAIAASPFDVALKGVGHFPPGKHARVLWVGMTNNEELVALQQQVESALVQAGVTPEQRGFSPHITIARLKETPLRFFQAFEEEKGGFATPPFTVTEFYLYSSTLTSSGAVHRRLATCSLVPR